MLRITDSKSAAGAKEYFDKSLRHADYYADGQESVGLWHGLAAPRLGLRGAVDREAFRALIDNRHPGTGERLTPRMKADRRPGADFTFNAPKSVSLLYAVTKDERIVDGFRHAVAATMDEVEREAKTRVRVDGRNEDRVTGNMVWAEFLHTTARPVDGLPDPHLHIHAYAPSLTFDPIEGRWKALQLGDIKGDGAYFEAVFLSRLAVEMRRLGYGVERHGRYWDVAGVPRALIEAFSRRTDEIERTAAKRGITDPVAKGRLGARTRERKAEELSLADLRGLWLSRFGPADRSVVDQVIAEARRREGDDGKLTSPAAAEAMDHALRHCFERASVARHKEVLAAAMHRSYGTASPDMVRMAASRLPLIRREIDGKALVSTPAVLAEESATLAFARDGRLTCRSLGPPGHLPAHPTLTGDQRQALERLLASPDRLTILRGGAGTGKTTLMVEAVAGIRAAGRRTEVFAPTSAAREMLRQAGFPSAETLQRLLIDTEMQKRVQGSVLWIDEAGLISMPEMAKLTAIAQREQCRIVLSGDSRQHGAVGRGDALRLLEARAGIRPVELSQIIRQSGRYREAVAAVAEGAVERGFRRFEAMGAVVEMEGRERLTALAEDYAMERREGRSVLVVSPTHREKDAVTSAIRDALRDSGQLGRRTESVPVLRDLRWTEAERADPARYDGGETVKFHQNAAGFPRGQRLVVERTLTGELLARAPGHAASQSLPVEQADRFRTYRREALELRQGDLIRITENGTSSDGHRLNNGSIYRVRRFDRAGDIVLDENGWTVARDFGHLDYGYCTTSVSAQGRTVDTVLVAMGESSVPAMSREQFYVTVSRGRDAARLYTDDKAAVLEAIAASGARGTATELVAHQVDRTGAPTSRKERLAEHTDSMGRQLRRWAHQHVGQAHFERGNPPSQVGIEITEPQHRGRLERDAQEVSR